MICFHYWIAFIADLETVIKDSKRVIKIATPKMVRDDSKKIMLLYGALELFLLLLRFDFIF